MKRELLNRAPPGMIAKYHPSIWIQLGLFTARFKHCIKYLKPTEVDPAVLILDRHYSQHDLIDLALNVYVATLRRSLYVPLQEILRIIN